ncbi:MAG: helix-turn-helix transcriptional regulator [Ruminococcaceae bacterium]|nr:helix-turn-helix transcriptional regulator [Oscillospiraceae bacterium]
MIPDKIKELREQAGDSQAQLAKKLDVTRSAVNAWEMGLSTPTTQYIVALAKLYHVSTDYILGVTPDRTISLRGYSEDEVRLVLDLLRYFDRHH